MPEEKKEEDSEMSGTPPLSIEECRWSMSLYENLNKKKLMEMFMEQSLVEEDVQTEEDVIIASYEDILQYHVEQIAQLKIVLKHLEFTMWLNADVERIKACVKPPDVIMESQE